MCQTLNFLYFSQPQKRLTFIKQCRLTEKLMHLHNKELFRDQVDPKQILFHQCQLPKIPLNLDWYLSLEQIHPLEQLRLLPEPHDCLCLRIFVDEEIDVEWCINGVAGLVPELCFPNQPLFRNLHGLQFLQNYKERFQLIKVHFNTIKIMQTSFEFTQSEFFQRTLPKI